MMKRYQDMNPRERLEFNRGTERAPRELRPALESPLEDRITVDAVALGQVLDALWADPSTLLRMRSMRAHPNGPVNTLLNQYNEWKAAR